MVDNRIDMDYRADIDLTDNELFKSFPDFVPFVNVPDDIGNQPISGATNLNGLSILLSMIGVVSFYF